MKKQMGWYAAGLLALAMVVRAGIIVYNANLVNETALAHDNTYVLDLQNNGVNSLSAQATYSSATITSASFGDGRQSTGSITVLSYAALVAAPAVDSITVVSNTGLTGASLYLPGYVLAEGVDWRTQSTTSGTAESLRLAMAQIPFLSVSRAGSVLYATAPAGSYYNGLQMVSSTPTALTVANATFAGGQDNAVVRINGVPFQQGLDFTASVDNGTTATSLKNAINANTALNGLIVASASGALITSTSTKNGTRYNLPMSSSKPSALSVSGINMVNGTNSAATLGSAVLHIPSHGLSSALPVLYGAPVGVLGGLADQTTYYVIPIGTDDLKLAASKVDAVAGTGIVVTSTSTQLSANAFSLSPLAIGGVPSFKWQASNDNVSWVDLAVSSVSVTSYSNPAASTIWSFGFIGTRYLRLNVVAPTTGGLGLNVRVIGTN